MRDRISLETLSVSLPFGIDSMSWQVGLEQYAQALATITDMKE